ncbi:hypothetical protein [Legionella shakespearei]|uniref:proton-translocating NAD(P)(+) transhydrogenase n=1 Tax=Legionella shakespearei DSM 23087 TaxID=1122169 RepID=A0A0W0YL62_9GAMM|nr:hypothetical protein [Legionella shakespearei]KTD57618.1 NAD(P) transhydrogenase subunit alpha [Legionella shakespearei DSM 23087]
MQSKIFLLRESGNNEQRVALIPRDVEKIIGFGAIVYVEDGAGIGAGYINEDYTAVGASIRQIDFGKIERCKQAFNDIDIIIRVKRPDRKREKIENKVIKPHTKMIGLLDILERGAEHIAEYAQANIEYYSLDQFVFSPGTPMDALKEMSRIAGKLALQHAIEIFANPVTRVSIIGCSEAGKAASQECIRLNLPHTIITSNLSKSKQLLSQGISSKVVERHLPLDLRQDKIYLAIKDSDIVITTASGAWTQAPLLIPEPTLNKLKGGTVIVDLATSDGGNVFGSKHDEIITRANNVKIINVSGYPKKAPIEASELLSRANCYFLNLLLRPESSLIQMALT